MDPRFDRAHGAMVGLFYGQALEVDTAVDKGSKSSSLSESILALMAATKSAKQPTFPCFTTPVDRFCGLMLEAVQLGIATSIGSPQAFVDALWNNSQKREPTRQDFQATALVAAAVSIGLDSPHFRVEDALVRAVDVVSSVEAHGEWSPEPDVVAATRRALNIASDVNDYIGFSLEQLSEQIGSAGSPTQIVPAAFALAARYQDRRLLISPLRLGAQAHTILSIVGALVGAVRGASFLRPYGLSRVEDACPLNLVDRAGNLLATRTPYPSGGLAPGGSAPPVAPSAPASFEEPSSSLHTRQRYFEPATPPTPLGAHRGESQTGRVLVLGELLHDQAMHSETYPRFGEHVWAEELGQSTGGMFRALVAARRMGAEVVSLCPIGEGPNAEAISQALAREGIVDAGPRFSGADNGYRLIFTADNGWRLSVSTKSPLAEGTARVWAEAIQSMGPSDVLCIDGALLAQQPMTRALRKATKGLPDHARVVFDASSHEGFLESLPLDNVIVSLRASQPPGFSGFFRHFNDSYPPFPFYEQNDDLKDQVAALAMLTMRYVVLRSDDGQVYYARPTHDDNRFIRPYVTRVAAPPLTKNQNVETASIHSATLAACLALGIPVKRGILLANCAAALATPTSLPTRDSLEAAAAELLPATRADKEKREWIHDSPAHSRLWQLLSARIWPTLLPRTRRQKRYRR